MSARAYAQPGQALIGGGAVGPLHLRAGPEGGKPPAIGVSLVHREKTARNSLSALLSGTAGFRCVGVYSRLEAAVAHAALEKPDVVLIDLLAREECVQAGVQQLRARFPRTESVVMVPTAEPRLVMALLEAGVSGCLLKPVSPLEMLQSIAAVHTSGAALSGEVARVLLAHVRKHGATRQALSQLTPREVEILEYLSRGYSSKEIARACAIGVQTVNSHLARIYAKLGVHSRAGAVGKFLAA